MVRIPSSGSVRLHGGVASSSSWPVIEVNFNVTFARDDPSDLSRVHFTMSGIGRGNTYTSGKFGYNFQAAVGFNSPDTPDSWDYVWQIMNHSASQSSYWYNHLFDNVTDGGNRSGYFTCTDSTATVKIYVRCYVNDVYECCYNSNLGRYCYNNRHMFYKVYSQVVDIPPYEVSYTVDYNANGGVGAPESQTKTNLTNLKLSSDIPTYLVDITHHNNPNNVLSVDRPFLKWNTNAGGTGTNYNPGQMYYNNASMTLYAQWGSASFSPVTVPTKNIIVTYEANGGVGIPASTTLERTSLGYNTDSSASTATYVPGTTYTTTTNLDLYPIYGTATLIYANLPVPTKPGYTFKGWFTNPEFDYNTEITTDLSLTVDTIIYAKWELMPLHQLENGEWNDTGPYVWRKVDNAWYKIAHTYKCVEVNGVKQWIDLVEAPQPADVFNHGNIVGMNPYYADGIVKYNQNNNYYWSYNNISITKPYGYNAMMTLGGLCDRGNFRYLCFECEGSGTSGEYNYFYVGIRFMRKGKGSSWSDIPNVFYKVTDYREHKPSSSRQVLKLDLYQFSAEPFYISVISCDCNPYIYSMWFE